MSLPYTIYNDEPIRRLADDLLAQKTLVDEIAETIGNRVKPPFIASVNGDWGQGKTSLLRSVFETLTGDPPFQSGSSPGKTPRKKPSKYPHVRVIWFEAWRYQHEQTPIVALLNEIRRQFSAFSRALDFANKELQIALESSLLAMDGLISLIGSISGTPPVSTGGLVSTIKTTGEAWEQRNLAYSLPSETVRGILNKTISDLLDTLALGETTDSKRAAAGGDNKRLVIIIDDLDRCQPVTTYRFLEGIKVFLNLPSCSVLLGANRREVQRSVAVGLAVDSGLDNLKDTFATEEKLVRLAAEYHEKICSFAWDIPFPSAAQSADYLRRLLESALADQLDPVPAHALCAAVHGILTAEKDLRLLPANPRRIKAFANSFLRLIHPPAGNPKSIAYPDKETPLVLLLAAIAAFHPPLHRRLLANPRAFTEIWENIREAYNETAAETGSQRRLTEINGDEPLRCTSTDIMYADPGDTRVFRMAPLLDKMKDNPPTDLIQRYLRHAS